MKRKNSTDLERGAAPQLKSVEIFLYTSMAKLQMSILYEIVRRAGCVSISDMNVQKDSALY